LFELFVILKFLKEKQRTYMYFTRCFPRSKNGVFIFRYSVKVRSEAEWLAQNLPIVLQDAPSFSVMLENLYWT